LRLEIDINIILYHISSCYFRDGTVSFIFKISVIFQSYSLTDHECVFSVQQDSSGDETPTRKP